MPHWIPFSAEQVRSLQAGTAQGLLPSLLRPVLTAASWPYGWFVQRKNHGYDSGRKQPTHAGVPTISVGNLTTGGTGKTPLVCWLAEFFQKQEASPLLISRGYGSRDGVPNDEARELAARLPNVPHVQMPDRIAAAKQILTANPDAKSPVLILDDAFQHRRIARDLDIVVLDALCPFGFERLLPRGLLREPIGSLSRAHVIALSRSDAITPQEKAAIREKAEGYAPNATWIELVTTPSHLLALDGTTLPLQTAAANATLAFCGIGNPQGFSHSLSLTGITPKQLLPFPDHHLYSTTDFQQLLQTAKQLGATQLICTHKDLVKFDPAWQSQLNRSGITLHALVMQLEITTGQQVFQQRLCSLLS